MKTVNYTDLNTNLKHYIDSVFDDTDTLIIHRESGKGLVLMPLDEYNSLKETEYIMSSPQTMDAIREGENDLRRGNVISQKKGENIADFLKRVSCTE
jgi:antitoxin YefM